MVLEGFYSLALKPFPTSMPHAVCPTSETILMENVDRNHADHVNPGELAIWVQHVTSNHHLQLPR